VIIVIAVIVVVVATSTSATAVHTRQIIGHDAQSAISQLKSLIGANTKK
jgi:predicted small secreted protein